MKNRIKFLSILIPVIAILFLILHSRYILHNKHNENAFDVSEFKKIKKDNEHRGTPGFQNQYFGKTHYPQGASIGTETFQKMWDETQRMPNEAQFDDTSDPWAFLGPHGNSIDSTGIRKYSGRVLDLRLHDSNLKVATATGGLWVSNGANPTTLTDNLSSLAVGSFDIQPGDSNVIIVGTGEPNVLNGTGLYRTTNRGLNWTRISMGNTPTGFFKIRYAPNSQSVIHAATKNGYYRSDNNGLNWTRYLEAEVSDLDINPQSPNIVYCGVWDRGTGNGGVYKSTDSGTNWNKITAAGIPTSNVGRVSLSICKNIPNLIWVLMGRNDNNFMMGVYKTNADQVSWTNVSPPHDILGGGFGWYVHAIGASPTNPQVAFVGGIWLFRTNDGGLSWDEYNDVNTGINLHADQHEVLWHPDGQKVWIGNDGGVSFSNDGGFTFTTEDNFYPVTQYVNFDVGQNNSDVIFGGSRDNAFTGTTNGGLFWKYTFNGAADGGGIAIDPFNNSIIYGTLGNIPGPVSFGRWVTFNSGQSWSRINDGIGPSTEEYPKIRTLSTSPTALFTNSWTGLYKSDNFGGSWSLEGSAFPHKIYDFAVKKFPAGGLSNIYVWLESGTSGSRLYIKENDGSFVERSAGLPGGQWVRNVTPHPANHNIAYALMTGLETGLKVYKTTNLGLNWTNISGNLPNVPMSGIVVHPQNSNILYLGTELGCYKTTNNGTEWFRWNESMPEAAIVTEMKSYTTASNEFYVILSTYGRGIYKRKDVYFQANYGSNGQTGDNLYYYANSTSGASGAPSQPQFIWKDTTGSINLYANGTNMAPGIFSGNDDNGRWDIVGGLGGGNIKFFGQDYTNVYIGTNGILGFNDFNVAATQPPSTGLNQPDITEAIFPLWMDMNIGYTGVTDRRISYKVTGTELIVTYSRIPVYAPSSLSNDPERYVSFQVIIGFNNLTPAQNSDIFISFDDSQSGALFKEEVSNETLRMHLIGIQKANTAQQFFQYRFYSDSESLSYGPIFSSPLTIALGSNENSLPVELTSFVSAVDRRDVRLSWTTESEMNNSGFDVERSIVNSQISNEWIKLGFVEGSGTHNEAKSYSFTDGGLNTGKYKYRLKQIDYNGNFEYFSLSNEVIIGVPGKFDLSQNYPNPFNSVTKINFDLPFDGKVTMKVFDMTGREIATLINEVQTAGYHTVTFDTKSLSSGMYFYILQAGEFTKNKKMVLIK